LLLLLAGASPIATENKPGNTGGVEILVEQLPKPGLPQRGIGLVVEQFDGTAPKLVHKGGGIGRIYQRGSRQRCGGDNDEQAGQKGTAHHVGRTSAKSWSYPIA